MSGSWSIEEIVPRPSPIGGKQAVNDSARAPLTKYLFAFKRSKLKRLIDWSRFASAIHNYSTMVSHSSTRNGQCKCLERNQNWYLDQISTAKSKNQLASTEIRGWYQRFFIATSSCPDIRKVSFPLYFTMALGEDASSAVTTLPDAGKYWNWFNMNF